jgi:hypothetical protein
MWRARQVAADGIAMEVLPATLLTGGGRQRDHDPAARAVVIGSLPPGGLAAAAPPWRRAAATRPGSTRLSVPRTRRLSSARSPRRARTCNSSPGRPRRRCRRRCSGATPRTATCTSTSAGEVSAAGRPRVSATPRRIALKSGVPSVRSTARLPRARARTFDYLKWFPESRRAALFAPSESVAPPLYRDHVTKWLDDKQARRGAGTAYDWRRIVESRSSRRSAVFPVREIDVERSRGGSRPSSAAPPRRRRHRTVQTGAGSRVSRKSPPTVGSTSS